MHRVSLSRGFVNNVAAMLAKIKAYKSIVHSSNREAVMYAIFARKRPDTVTATQRSFLRHLIDALELPPALAEEASSEFFPKWAYTDACGVRVPWTDVGCVLPVPGTRKVDKRGAVVQGTS